MDRNISGTGNDFIYLTSLLHEKQDSHTITFHDIEPLYQNYLGVTAFDASVNGADYVLEKLFSICDDITSTDTKLENKIILAIGIRHKAEEFMISNIETYAGTICWHKHRCNKSGSGSDFLAYIFGTKNQTRALLEGYKQFGDANKMKILNEVSIMTPEHIHINSFMYEPLLDMDITELLGLYNRVKTI